MIVPSAGQNRRVPVFGALDAMTGQLTPMITEHKRSDDFIAFLHLLVDRVYADRRHVYLFLDNCSIHHTQAVRQFLAARRERVTVIWNARYAPNLNLIERFWGHLKLNAFHNYFFGSVTALETAIKQTIKALNRDANHPLHLNLRTAQALGKAA